MKVLYIAAECKPFSKVGGVGDVAGELPPALRGQGVKVEVVTPAYATVEPGFIGPPSFSYDFSYNGKTETVEVRRGDLEGIPVHFLKNPNYFEGTYGKPYIDSSGIPYYDDSLRFSFFSYACLPLIARVKPDIVHINDWALGYLFGLMARDRMSEKRVLTVHNIGYQGNIGREVLEDWSAGELLGDPKVGPLFRDPRPRWKSVNPLRLALELAHEVNTVSPTYAKEILKPENPKRYFEGGKGLEPVTRRLAGKGRLTGILNGFRYGFDPTEDRLEDALREKQAMRETLAASMGGKSDLILGFVGRAVEQKVKLLLEPLRGKSVLRHLLGIKGVSLAVVATGLPEYEKKLRKANRKNLSLTLAFDRDRARQVMRGADVFLMPSLFEPCGITQLEAMSVATPPLVRWTGGLCDTVRPHDGKDGTGFGFEGKSKATILSSLVKAVRAALELRREHPEAFHRLQKNGFHERYDWSDSAREYAKMYARALARK